MFEAFIFLKRRLLLANSTFLGFGHLKSLQKNPSNSLVLKPRRVNKKKREMSASYLRANIAAEEQSWKVLPMVRVSSSNDTAKNRSIKDAFSLEEEDEEVNNDDTNTTKKKEDIISFEKFFEKCAKKYQTIESVFDNAKKTNVEDVPFQFFPPAYDGCDIECAIETKYIEVVKTVVQAEGLFRFCERDEFLLDDFGDDEKILKVLPDAVLNSLMFRSSKFEGFGFNENASTRRFALRVIDTSNKSSNAFICEGIDIERPFVRREQQQKNSMIMVDNTYHGDEKEERTVVPKPTLDFASVTPFKLSMKLVGDLQAACKNAKVRASDVNAFFPPSIATANENNTKKRKQENSSSVVVDYNNLPKVLDISKTPICVVAMPRVNKDALVVALRRELPESLQSLFERDEDFLRAFALSSHLSCDDDTCLITRMDLKERKEFYGVKYVDIKFELEEGIFIFPIQLILKKNGAVEVVKNRNNEGCSQNLAIKNLCEGIENKTHLGVSLSFERNAENTPVPKVLLQEKEGDQDNDIDPLMRSLLNNKDSSPPFLGFRIDQTPSELRRAVGNSAEQLFGEDLMGFSLGTPSSMLPLMHDLQQMPLIDSMERHQCSFLITPSTTNRHADRRETLRSSVKRPQVESEPDTPEKVVNIPSKREEKAAEKAKAEAERALISKIDSMVSTKNHRAVEKLTIVECLLFIKSRDRAFSEECRIDVGRRKMHKAELVEIVMRDGKRSTTRATKK